MAENNPSPGNIIARHFFDFFMLFLAITLGFFVDNYRDSYLIRKNAHELAADLVDDLAADTVSLRRMLSHSETKMEKLDSLYELLRDDITSVNPPLLYRYSAYMTLRPWFDRHAATYKMLTNSGYLSYFSKDASSTLTRYDLACEKTLAILGYERAVIANKIYPFQQQIFHMEHFEELLKENNSPVNAPLHQWTPDNKWVYHNYVTEMITINNDIHDHYQLLLSLADSTIQVLQQQYRPG